MVGQTRLDNVANLADRHGPAARHAIGASALRHDSRVQQALAALRPQLDDDGRLIAVLQRTPVVLGFHQSNEPGAARIGPLPAPLLPTALLGDPADSLLRWAGQGGNLPPLQAAAQLGAGQLGAGRLNALIDSDGPMRRLPLLVAHDGGVHAALALVMARALLATPATCAAGLPATPATGAAGLPRPAQRPAPSRCASSPPAGRRAPFGCTGRAGACACRSMAKRWRWCLTPRRAPALCATRLPMC